IDGFVRDLVHFLDELHIDSAHVVAAKLGGTIALQLAADHPERVRSLSILSSPVRARNPGASSPLESFADDVRAHGVRKWVEDSQRARLGSGVSAAQFDWWTDFMASVDPRVCAEVTALAGRLDITGA